MMPDAFGHISYDNSNLVRLYERESALFLATFKEKDSVRNAVLAEAHAESKEPLEAARAEAVDRINARFRRGEILRLRSLDGHDEYVVFEDARSWHLNCTKGNAHAGIPLVQTVEISTANDVYLADR